jgi:glutamate-1-semialdehyde 2,1-aminomutase
MTHGHPSSPGVPESVTINTALVPYNDLAAAREIFAKLNTKIAAMIIEPICGNIGVVPPEPGYLEGLRELCDAAGALLIFDEVMTGFRVALGGAQGLYSVRPDITCLGKIIGGGLPVGAYGARAELMNQISPAGPIYQAGTLSGNPLSMAAGVATLSLLEEGSIYTQLEDLGARLENGLREAAAAAGISVAVQRVGTVITTYFNSQAQAASTAAAGSTPVLATPRSVIRNYADALQCDTAAYARFFRSMLDAGVMLPPSQFEAWFVSSAHTEADIDMTLDAAREAFRAAKQNP